MQLRRPLEYGLRDRSDWPCCTLVSQSFQHCYYGEGISTTTSLGLQSYNYQASPAHNNGGPGCFYLAEATQHVFKSRLSLQRGQTTHRVIQPFTHVGHASPPTNPSQATSQNCKAQTPRPQNVRPIHRFQHPADRPFSCRRRPERALCPLP